MSSESRSAKYIGFAVLGAAIAIAAWLSWNTIQSMQARANRSATKEDIKRIMLAMHSYHDVHDNFSPAYVLGPDGKRWHSWRALILPYLEPELANRYRFDEPWNGPHNKILLANAPEVYRSDTVGLPSDATSYFAVVGKRTLWPAHQSMSIQKCRGDPIYCMVSGDGGTTSAAVTSVITESTISMNASADVGRLSATIVHLANIAACTGQVLWQ